MSEERPPAAFEVQARIRLTLSISAIMPAANPEEAIAHLHQALAATEGLSAMLIGVGQSLAAAEVIESPEVARVERVEIDEVIPHQGPGVAKAKILAK